MRLRLSLLILLALAGGAAAQPPETLPQRPDEAPEGPPRLQLFISPMGEPFRGGGGLQAWFARADADRDGRISRDEFQADGLPFFHRLDTDRDGRIDGFETQAYERDIVPEITDLFGGFGGGVRPGGGPPRGGGLFGRSRPKAGEGMFGREGAARFGLLNTPQPIRACDLGFDGKVTLDEWKRTAALRFDMLDTTKAGVLTLDTLPGRKPPAAKPAKR